ncbi:MAG: hypothetical protein ABSC65_24570 [Acidobacteriaceae bacterium]|jgi:hypothetical protein
MAIESHKDITLAPADPEVWTFFYGSYINLNVLREVNYVPEKYRPANTVFPSGTSSVSKPSAPEPTR